MVVQSDKFDAGQAFGEIVDEGPAGGNVWMGSKTRNGCSARYV